MPRPVAGGRAAQDYVELRLRVPGNGAGPRDDVEDAGLQQAGAGLEVAGADDAGRRGSHEPHGTRAKERTAGEDERAERQRSAAASRGLNRMTRTAVFAWAVCCSTLFGLNICDVSSSVLLAEESVDQLLGLGLAERLRP